MKKSYLLTMVAAILGALFLGLVAFAQGTYDAEWHTFAGGGGVSTGSIFTVRGTAGQPDAGVSSGVTYTVQGGFWGGAAGEPTAVTLASFSATPAMMLRVLSPHGTPGLLRLLALIAAGGLAARWIRKRLTRAR